MKLFDIDLSFFFMSHFFHTYIILDKIWHNWYMEIYKDN